MSSIYIDVWGVGTFYAIVHLVHMCNQTIQNIENIESRSNGFICKRLKIKKMFQIKVVKYKITVIIDLD